MLDAAHVQSLLLLFSGHEIRLDMWGKCVTRFDGRTILAAGEKEPVVAIFVGTLTKIFKGHAMLSLLLALHTFILLLLSSVAYTCNT